MKCIQKEIFIISRESAYYIVESIIILLDKGEQEK